MPVENSSCYHGREAYTFDTASVGLQRVGRRWGDLFSSPPSPYILLYNEWVSISVYNERLPL